MTGEEARERSDNTDVTAAPARYVFGGLGNILSQYLSFVLYLVHTELVIDQALLRPYPLRRVGRVGEGDLYVGTI